MGSNFFLVALSVETFLHWNNTHLTRCGPSVSSNRQARISGLGHRPRSDVKRLDHSVKRDTCRLFSRLESGKFSLPLDEEDVGAHRSNIFLRSRLRSDDWMVNRHSFIRVMVFTTVRSPTWILNRADAILCRTVRVSTTSCGSISVFSADGASTDSASCRMSKI